MLKLIIEDDEGKTTVVPLIRDEITIGRKEGNTIRLTERNVSRRHAKLTRHNGQVVLEDLGSYNGIKVNGSRIQGQISVNEGDRIQIGDYMLALKQDQPATGASPTDPFDEMKTVPVEKAEAQALAAHMAQQSSPVAAPAPAVAPGTPPPTPAQASPPAAPVPLPPQAPPRQDLIEAAVHAREKDTQARMVAVSANFAGLEFSLDKAAQVIGRTDDNDIVVNHRSISRHHAKIIREGDSFIVVDQASANGVFVNGEKYDRVELRAGDMLDLGHVRLRFVAPGEDWIFDTSAVVDTGPAPTKSNTAMYAVIGLVVVVAVVVGLLFGTGVLGGKKDTEKPKKAVADEMAADSDATTGQPSGQDVSYANLEKAVSSKDWTTAIREADSILQDHAGDKRAQSLRQKALEEQKNEGNKTKFLEALKLDNLEQAVFFGSQIPNDSVYYGDVGKLLGNAKTKYLASLHADAKRLARTRECAQLRDVESKMRTLAPEDKRITELVRNCKPKPGEMVSEIPTDPGRRRPGMRFLPRPMPPPMITPPPQPGNQLTAGQLVDQARKAAYSSQYGKGLKLATKAYRKGAGTPAIMLIGVCACRMRRKARAAWAYRKLRGGNRTSLQQVCSGAGITLP